jgi:hypothetical protein
MTSSSKEVRASAFILEDEEGRERGGLSIEDGEPKLRLRDDAGRTRVLADISKGNPRLLITDEAGASRIGIDCYADGPSLFVSDSNGDVRIGLDYTDRDGMASISLSQGKQKTRVSLRVYADGRSSVTIWGDDNTIRAHLQVDDADEGSVLIAEAEGKVGFAGSAGALMLLRNSETKIIEAGKGE